jgi:hypothetical protein
MSIRKPKAGSFETILSAVDVDVEVAGLVRLSRYPSSEPWWGKTRNYRFDDPLQQYGVTYLADDIETAFCESVIHGSGLFNAGQWAVPSTSLRGRFQVRYRLPAAPSSDLARALRMADLTGFALKKLGLNNDMSATDNYDATQAWSRAIHESSSDWDGVRFVSRQLNTRYCYAVFERSGLRKSSQRPLSGAALNELVERFNVAELVG